jgi:hypothetical protein
MQVVYALVWYIVVWKPLICRCKGRRGGEAAVVHAHTGMPHDLRLMDKLMRLRSLAAKAFRVLGLGMCLRSFPEWRQPLPGALLLRLERFYHAEEWHERAPAPVA